ncbi:MAG: hypothetical protein A4S09_02750 [Proteobacteria bacterium SG_bin7]|nr:MAG: hypothetical protein A4S09_02750 [Proteobacteria bacterium SG_bin7]
MAKSLLKKRTFLVPTYLHSLNQSKRLGSQGQIAIEYVLILFVCVIVAVLVSKELVSRDPQDPGHIVKAWVSILQTVGNDLADAPTR